MYTRVMRMIRKQVYIGAGQEAVLKRAARARGVSEAEIIRQGIELASQESPTERRRSPLAEQAWQEIMEVLEERRRMDAPPGPRGWTRDELYEKRLARIAP